ncbi:uncharacterized protein LOC143220098 [Lasioglossum baleicum]|uniref:uncharacterized protein LOC143220098 n=1 Tax=Lasioglossum baleicum TaxID=434251 RepID=UPI003FCE2ED0
MQKEAFSVVPDQLSPEETRCESHFVATHARNSEGRYIVRLPFKRIPENLGNSRSQALRVLTRQEKRFSKDSTMQNAYVSFMEEYENLGHMRRAADTNPDQNRVYYLPHLCVIRESSSSTKYRVVFNGSQQTDRGISFNDCLHEGPKLLKDLSDFITLWLVFKFVFSADVSKMCRQILVHPEDQDFQRILWRNSRGELVEFALCTVTYGLWSAPFLANRTLRKLDKDEGHRFPLAEGVIKEGTYVDDVFSGAHSLEQGQLWSAHLGWDEPLPQHLAARWMDYARLLRDVTSISVPRWLGLSPSALGVEIHGFSDASHAALGVVVYVRELYDVDNPKVTIVSAKTKVAPIKKHSSTAKRSCTTRIQHALKVDDAPVLLWTDSTTALHRIQGHPSRWKDFVRNRVFQIQELEDVDLEERQKTVTLTNSDSSLVWNLISRYSRLVRLLRITAWSFRVVERFRRRERTTAYSSPLQPEDIENARRYWVKSRQESYFFKVMQQLLQGGKLSRSSHLIRLVPFLDSDGMLSVGGRLRNALLDPDVKHPLILPQDSELTHLVLDDVHRATLHGGAQVMLATLRRSYWIIGGRVPVRSFVLRCVICTRQRAATATQLMGQLPMSRTLPSRLFLHSGVDYAGPFTVKTWRGRAAKTYKGYLVVFVCFSSSAVHLDLATDYSTAGFLAAYKRFTGRHGICATLTSDCATNLVGADSELRRLFDSSSRKLADLANLLANDGTKWSFNPPAAPYFGGKWEAAVKSVKFHLKHIIGETSVTYEEFSTLLVQSEAVLNSRPI